MSKYICDLCYFVGNKKEMLEHLEEHIESGKEEKLHAENEINNLTK